MQCDAKTALYCSLQPVCLAPTVLLQKLRAAGQRVHAWTANTAGMVRELARVGCSASCIFQSLVALVV